MFRNKVRTLRVQQDFHSKWKIIESSDDLPESEWEAFQTGSLASSLAFNELREVD